MKKHLLSTSAIALSVAAAAPAAAQDWDVSFSGFMSQHVGYADVNGSLPAGDQDGVDLHSNTEIWFTPSVTLDNGLTFGVTVELEGENTGSEIDESYMTISSDTLGQIIIGSENSAGYKSMVAAPSVISMAINSPSISTFLPFSAANSGLAGQDADLSFRQAGLSSFTEVGGNNDVQRLTYFTPSFNGLTLGVSYAPTGSVNVGNSYNVDRDAVLSDIFDVGLNYSQSFGAVSLNIGARYGTGDAPTGESDPETYGVGFQIGYDAFTFGAAYANNDNASGGSFGNDSEGYSVGMTYDIAGPWAIGAQAYFGEVDGNPGQGDTSYDAYRIGASRDLGPGVDWDIYIANIDTDTDQAVGFVDDDGTPVIQSATGGDARGTVIGTGINLSF